MRWTLLFLSLLVAACSQQHQTRVDPVAATPARHVATASPPKVVSASVSAPIGNTVGVQSDAAATSKQEIAQKIIAASITNYPGSCPCPYNTDRAGRRCGGRSAYSKPGGYAPLCFEQDITPEMFQEHQQNAALR